jgi:hypothetical protein
MNVTITEAISTERSKFGVEWQFWRVEREGRKVKSEVGTKLTAASLKSHKGCGAPTESGWVYNRLKALRVLHAPTE